MSPNAFDLPETTIECGVCLMLGEVFEQTVSPLFGDSVVDVVEWPFDMAWELPGLSPWLQESLADFSQRDAVLRHGVSFSCRQVTYRSDSRPGWGDSGTRLRLLR